MNKLHLAHCVQAIHNLAGNDDGFGLGESASPPLNHLVEVASVAKLHIYEDILIFTLAEPATLHTIGRLDVCHDRNFSHRTLISFLASSGVVFDYFERSVLSLPI